MKKWFYVFEGLSVVLVVLMAVGMVLHFPDTVIRTVGILMLICVVCLSFSAVRMKNEKNKAGKKEERR